MSSNIGTTITRIIGRVRNLERKFRKVRELEKTVDALLLNESKPFSIQMIDETFVELTQLDPNELYYCSNEDKLIFKTSIETIDHAIMDIKISSSFIVKNVNSLQNSSVVLKLKINKTLVNENETFLLDDGYNHLTLNYIENVEPNSIYNIEILFEGCITTLAIEQDTPILSIRNNGASLSILVI